MRNSIFKKAGSIILAYIMLLGVSVFPVFAQETTPVNVTTAQELETAILAGEKEICITNDMEIDRTFYITGDIMIYSSQKVVLTRANNFAGDFFVVGEDATGNPTENESGAVLTLGNPDSSETNLIVLDGNKNSMTVDVTGSAIFVCGGNKADLYSNLTIQNFKKTGNVRALEEKHGLSYTNRVGGAGAILASGSQMNIYGGIYKNNEVNDISEAGETETPSFQGGFAYNFGTLNIYGGTFEANHAARGAFVYNYRKLNLYAGDVKNNTSSSLGGAIYVPNSTGAILTVGAQNDVVTPYVSFTGNTAQDDGGAIYARNKISINNTSFTGNHSAGYGGAIAAYTTVMTIENSTFENNTSASHGAAVYLTGSNEKEDPELTLTKSVFKGNAATKNGGAIYVSASARIYAEDNEFTENTANYGGAIYSTGANIEINDAVMNSNNSNNYGGAVALYSSSVAKFNNISADGNSGSRGGFLYVENSELKMYNSSINNSECSGVGGAIAFYDGAVSEIYATTFKGNKATGNGSAVMAYTGGTNIVLHTCEFINNSTDAYGGALYASNKSLVDMYNITAEGNSASKGGVIYETTTGTVINLAGIQLSGNTATDSAPIIWGNSTGAKLNIDKSKYIDLDYTGDWDSEYWASAIYNKLKVAEVTLDVPDYIDYDGTTVSGAAPTISANVNSSAQLERALNSGLNMICITGDFEIDRTFYITRNTTIYSSSKYTLTRATDFAGDLFVVGEDKNGNTIESEEEIVLTLGDPDSTQTDLLVLDGNKDNMTVDVTGSAIFVCKGNRADLYPNLTIANFKKTGNVRALEEKHGLSYTSRVGGAGVIIASGAKMDIYGGIYKNNEVNDISEAGEAETLSFHGGLVYNFGTLNVYGGTFEANHAARGAVIYNYRKLNLYAGDIKYNTSSSLGGAIYMPNSTGAVLTSGEQNDIVTPKVLFTGNTAQENGGAIYARNKLNINNTIFKDNHSAGSGGAIAAYTTLMTISGSTFENNTSASHGAAVYLNGSNEKTEPELTLTDSVFKGNTATKNGGAVYVTASARMYAEDNEFTENTANYGGAIYVTGSTIEINDAEMNGNSTKYYGGAVALYATSVAKFNALSADGNSGSRGGFMYTENSELKMYNSTIKNSECSGVGGAIAFYDGAVSEIYATTFEGNKATGNGGAIVTYTGGTNTVLHTCNFINNSSDGVGGVIYSSGKSLVDIYNMTATGNSATKGGVIYETTTGTVINLIGATVSGNTATESAPIIWGNSTGAKLNIDKSKYVDGDVQGTLDSTYWSSAIVNKLNVTEIEGEVPKYLDYGNESYDHMSDAVDVKSSQELEATILSGAKHIRVVADFEIDRTFYITDKVTIFSTAPYTLTRAADFGGDIFVVGENEVGTTCVILGTEPVLTLGNSVSEKENLLTIDGNKDNMTVDVKGTVIFITSGAQADLYKNVSIINCHKASNERTYSENYIFSRPNRVGGAVSIVENGTINFYGGNYKNNSVRDEVILEDATDDSGRDSTLGGVVYNNGNLRIYGGTFEGNYAARGGVSYSFKQIRVTAGSFTGNHASASGGVFYMPTAAAAHTVIGTEETGTEQTVFKGNTAQSHGGVIYSSPLCALIVYGNTVFEENQAIAGSGGAVCVYGQFTVRDTVFRGNIAASRGGAVYASRSGDAADARHVTFEDCTFENNEALLGGALNVYASSMDYPCGAIAFATNTDFIGNYAKKTETSNGAGGAVHIDRQGSFTATDCNFTDNHSDGEAGAIYVSTKSEVILNGGTFKNNYTNAESGSHGGALSVRSSILDAENTSFEGNKSHANGGAIYVSYVSSTDVNSTVSVNGASFKDNATDSYGGAFYVTRQTVDEANDTRILSVTDSSFNNNTSLKSGGVVYLASKVDAYFKDSEFISNTASGEQGGVLYTTGGIAKFEECTFTNNTAKTTGGAISVPGNAQITLYKATATGNTAENYGGFLYSENANLNVFEGTFSNNTSNTAGGAMAFFGTAVSNIYDAEFTSNTAKTNGGALFIYTESTKTVLHSNKFTGNVADNYGGAIEMSKVSLVDIYNITGTNNSAKYGGFIYETSAGTTVNLIGATVSGNTATEGGPIIWGNTYNADLYIDKSKYTDLDAQTALDAAYWASAIVNKLTVIETEGTVPEKQVYVPEQKDTDDDSTTKTPVPVTDVLSLGLSSSDGYINAVYDALPRLDNSSNFMSKNTIVYPDINGEDVTVDTFVYPEYGTSDNMNAGQGIMIYQTILYKQAHPDEEVQIDISSYRFSIEAAVNINRNSRYFGYMRNLVGRDYDEYGFVRISYLLITAAKMGINVNVTGHIDGYPISASDPDLSEYFTNQLNDPCDPAYVENGVIGDYMNFTHCQWPLDSKGGTDMMHTKMCAVSHYLDMNGEVHKNAVFSSSSNLDGIRSDAANGNWKLQTGTIISDHEQMYKAAVNYLSIVNTYGKYQEGIFEFQNLVNERSTQQIDMILAGNGNQIPENEQIVYLGTENDPVFEMYFTPFGGGTLEWSEKYNPYCKYLRKLYNSEDYIIFTWNAAEYSSGFALGQQIENVIVEAFHKNPNPKNRFYGVMDTFDGTRLSDLVIGEDIGYVSVNERPFGQVHNKDVQVSYVENGKRQYVTLLNSLNLHSGSMYYQSNFLIVVKETELKENGVFFTIAENSTKGIVEHSYGEEQVYYPSNTEDGYYYKQCTQCDKRVILEKAHHAGNWIVHNENGEFGYSIQKKLCNVCGDLLETREYISIDGKETISKFKEETGKTFTAENSSLHPFAISRTPHTIQAKVWLPQSYTGRGGVILGNYETVQDNQLNLEIYTEGKVRLYYIDGYSYVSCVFDPDIRSDEPVHITVTVEDTTAKLYLNGVLADTKTVSIPMPDKIDGLKIGSDNREGNPQYFKGTVYSVNLFADVRTEEEILRDVIFVSNEEDNLIYTKVFAIKDTGKISQTDNLGSYFDGSSIKIDSVNSKAPLTIEAGIQVDRELSGRGGVIVGNYNGGNHDQLNLEVYNGGKIRLFYVSKYKRFDHVFSTDIRSDEYAHIAVAVDNNVATLYINGEPAESVTLTVPFPTQLSDFKAGGDNRTGNPQYFKGKILYIHMFSDIRDASEINKDKILVSGSSQGLLASYYFNNNEPVNNIDAPIGQTFTNNNAINVGGFNAKAPHTFEAYINVPKGYDGRAGVIAGNYGTNSPDQISLEIYENGKVRLFYMNKWVRQECIFAEDIRSEDIVHIAVTVYENIATLYVNGRAVESKYLDIAYPETISDLKIGGDNRAGNTQYFKGTIYSIAMFGDIRTEQEILDDMAINTANDSGLIISGMFLPMTDTDNKSKGKQFNVSDIIAIPDLTVTPRTVEAWVKVPLNQTERAGVLLGNYDNGASDQLNIEIYNEGRIRLFYISGGVRYDHVFSTDIRSNNMTHIAVTVEGDIATLFVNGIPVETAELTVPFANTVQSFKLGGDNRYGNTQYFKGTVYSVALFENARSDAQIALDMSEISLGSDVMYFMEVSDEPCPNGDGINGHYISDWITDITESDGAHGIYHNQCDLCGKVLSYKSVYSNTNYGDKVDYADLGKTFESHTEIIHIEDTLSAGPETFEVLFQLSPTFSDRAGVLVGNYTSTGKNVINLEIYNNGQPRFYYRTNYTAYTIQFETDVRSENKTHIAIVVDSMTAKLYVDGILKETANMTADIADITDGFCIGGDARTSNYQNFKGTIYSVHLFSDVRTSDEIANDAVMVQCDDESLIYSTYLNK